MVGVEILNLSKRSPKLNPRELQFESLNRFICLAIAPAHHHDGIQIDAGTSGELRHDRRDFMDEEKIFVLQEN